MKNDTMFIPADRLYDQTFTKIPVDPTPKRVRTYSNTVVTWRLAESYNAPAQIAISGPEDVASMMRFLGDEATEQFYSLCLSSSKKILGAVHITSGLLNSSLVHPREVFRSAIVLNAASIICLHNHPSGNLEPSKEDIAVTKQLTEAGKIMGITLHDHIIVAGSGYTSMMERGLM